jgi:hypothetical protein
MAESVLVGPELEANPEWRSAVRQADRWVRELLGKWAASKRFEWQVVAGGPSAAPRFDFRMTETEFGSAVAERFDRFDIGNETVVKDRVLRLWGQLSQLASEARVEDIRRFGEELRREAALARQN